MSNYPQYCATPKAAIGQLASANTNRDGTGTIVTVFTAGANGSRIDVVDIQGTGTTTAGMVRLFIHDGTNARLWKEIPVTAITPSGTTSAFAYKLAIPEGLILPTGYSLRAAPHNAETFNVIARGGDF